MLSKMSRAGCLVLLAWICAASQGCAGGRTEAPAESARAKEPAAPGKMEEPPPTPEPAADESAALTNVVVAPPTPAEVSAAVERVFRGAVAVEPERGASFLSGDFNGDRSPDLAVVVRPAPGRVAELNDELASWMLVAPLDASARQQRPRAEDGDRLLVVIHGFGAQGWRDPQATQTYVLKGAAGERMRPRPKKQIVRPDSGAELPRLYGDVIAETVGARDGFIYYDGVRYSWYDPRTYRPPAPARLVHGRAEH